MKLKLLLSITCIAFLTGCTEQSEELIIPQEAKEFSFAQTRSLENDSTELGELREWEMTEEVSRLKKLYEQQTSKRRTQSLTPNGNTYDDTFWSNMYAIREMPATIKVRAKATSGSKAGYLNLSCTGKGKEVVLNNSNNSSNNRFYIKMLPASSGIPYLIYSVASSTPLTVGYYTKKPNEKILMSAKEGTSTLASTGWNLLPSNYYKNYYAIVSQTYLGQSDPNDQWSIFYHVLEAASGNKVRYAQRVPNKAQQEFQITPDAKFNLISLEYDIESPRISSSTFSKTVTISNLSSQEKNIDVPFDFYETETSYFNKTAWNVNLNFENTDVKFARPSVLNSKLITPKTDAPKDASFLNTSTQNISRHISYLHPIKCEGNSIAKLTLTFVKYHITAQYTAKAQFRDKNSGDVRECILKGTWSGSVVEDPHEIMPKGDPVFTPINGDGDIILKRHTLQHQDSLIIKYE